MVERRVPCVISDLGEELTGAAASRDGHAVKQFELGKVTGQKRSERMKEEVMGECGEEPFAPNEEHSTARCI